MNRVLRYCTVALSLLFFFFFVRVAAARFHYPFELEWMCGSVLDHIDRIRHHQPLYTRPTLGWVPFIYPPLYFEIAAWTAKTIPGYAGCRLISIVATGLQALCLWRIATRNGASRYWRIVGLGLFFACFKYTGFWYDVERTDSLFVATMMIGTWMLINWETVLGSAVAGFVLGLGFFIKQPALIFLCGGTVASLLCASKARSLIFVSAGALTVLGGMLWLQSTSNGWAYFYLFTLPKAQGVALDVRLPWVVRDLCSAFLLTVATGATVVHCLRRLSPAWRDVRHRATMHSELVFTAMLLCAFFASMVSRLHVGGADNVLMFWSTFACAAVSIVGTRSESALGSMKAGDGASAIAILIVLQFGVFAYSPSDAVPSEDNIAFGRQLTELVSSLSSESRGAEVLALSHGHLTPTSHAHTMAIADVERAGLLPADFATPFSQQRYSAILADSDVLDPRMAAVFHPMLLNYYPAERIYDQNQPDQETPDLPVGYSTAPRWVLRPRRSPLHDVDQARDERRIEAEFRLAESLTEGRLLKSASSGSETVEDLESEALNRAVVH